jgi:cyanophycinase-like exopeptidase
VFIAGGDQWNYVNLWKDTKVEDAINWVRNTKKGVVGGTSAGAAILGQYYFSAQNGTVTSAEAIANPYRSTVTLGRNDFLALPYMQNLIVDTHLNNPDRRGRITTFMARMSKDFAIRPYGIGLDENTAVCIEENGASKVFGNGYAFFLRQNTTSGTPERCVSGSSLDWYRSQAAVAVYRVGGTTSGANTFNLSSWSGTGGTSLFFYVDRGTFVQR